ncbi:MAG: TylF/MycF family methyltransferase [Acidobacteriaceae bacterium]|nr:TylF/MycF family methyltransferase [Acidobacteriaceae bacterium]
MSQRTADQCSKRYLQLMKRCLTRTIFPDSVMNINLVPTGQFDLQAREEGGDWPSEAETMIGMQRLDNLEDCVVSVIRDGIPGDLVETGVWRGGASIFMKAILEAFGARDRHVWLADSFQGLPEPNAKKYPADEGDTLSQFAPYLAVSVEKVKSNFERYDLLDDRVHFLEGWFRDTLPVAPFEKIAVLRLDGDMYESTIEALEYLYPKLSAGGYLIVDDYGALANCRAAVNDFRQKHHISCPVHKIDWTGVFWRR